MTYPILHNFKEEVFLPICAISDNIDFMLDKDEKRVITNDKVTCEVICVDYVHILSEEAKVLINRIYGMDDVYAFMKNWYNTLKYIQSMDFVHLRLKKI